MKRYFYVSNSLDDLERVANTLEASDISSDQINVLSNDDAGVKEHNLNQVYYWFRTDVISTTYRGLIVGLILAALVLFFFSALGATETVGFAPFIMLSVVCVGFCTWEGGLMGLHLPSARFKRFQRALKDGRHVLMIDADAKDIEFIDLAVAQSPGLHAAGASETKDQWAVATERHLRKFADWEP
jgi:hypothetical protein